MLITVELTILGGEINNFLNVIFKKNSFDSWRLAKHYFFLNSCITHLIYLADSQGKHDFKHHFNNCHLSKGTWHCTYVYFFRVLTTPRQGGCYYSHFINYKPEAEAGWMTCPKTYNQGVMTLGIRFSFDYSSAHSHYITPHYLISRVRMVSTELPAEEGFTKWTLVIMIINWLLLSIWNQHIIVIKTPWLCLFLWEWRTNSNCPII